MRQSIHRMVFLVFFLFLFTCGCSSEPPVKQPTVTVSDIELADVSLRAMTVNTTVLINNQNPVGGHLNQVMFDIWYLDEGKPVYLGHGEQSNIDVKESGNTSVEIPVTIGNLQALYALGSLSQKGSIVLMVNGSAFIDMKVTSWELQFEEEREFAASEFDAYFPVSAIASINVTEKVGQVKDLLSGLQGG